MSFRCTPARVEGTSEVRMAGSPEMEKIVYMDVVKMDCCFMFLTIF